MSGYRLRPGTVLTVSIAFFLAAINYLHSDVSLDFSDEGFLWYGARQVLRGQVPILDFQAYDPGRYYWCSAVLSALGDGLMHLRLAMGLFQWAGLALGLLALRRAVRSPAGLAAAGFLAMFFMMVPCRYFTACLPLGALFFAVRLAEEPSVRRHLAAGVYTGLAAFIAVNHGFYIFLAFAALMVHLRLKGHAKSGVGEWAGFAAGLGLGSLPWLYFFAAVPGFLQAFFERLTALSSAFGAGKMQVSFPFPWPWAVSWQTVSRELPAFHARVLEFANRSSIGVVFLTVIAYYLAAVPAALRMKGSLEGPRALFTASVFVGSFYLGHAAARMDLVYLGEGIFPVLAGLLSAASFTRAPFKRPVRAAVWLFVGAGLLSAGLRSGIVFKHMVPKEGMVRYPVGRDRIWLPIADAKYCDSFKTLILRHAAPEEPVLLTPLLATFYCLLDRESPVYETYFHIPPSPELEERQIRQLEEKAVRWAVTANLIVDGRREHAMSNSHPLLWKYLMERFEFVPSEGLRPGYFLMRKKP